jgi:hypothetical protein
MVKSSAAIRVAPLGDDSRNDPFRSTSEETSGNEVSRHSPGSSKRTAL